MKLRVDALPTLGTKLSCQMLECNHTAILSQSSYHMQSLNGYKHPMHIINPTEDTWFYGRGCFGTGSKIISRFRRCPICILLRHLSGNRTKPRPCCPLSDLCREVGNCFFVHENKIFCTLHNHNARRGPRSFPPSRCRAKLGL